MCSHHNPSESDKAEADQRGRRRERGWYNHLARYNVHIYLVCKAEMGHILTVQCTIPRSRIFCTTGIKLT